MHIHTCKHTLAHMYTHMHAVHIHTYTHLHTHACNAFMHTQMHTYMYTHIHIHSSYTHVQTYTHMYTYAQTYSHTYTHSMLEWILTKIATKQYPKWTPLFIQTQNPVLECLSTLPAPSSHTLSWQLCCELRNSPNSSGSGVQHYCHHHRVNTLMTSEKSYATWWLPLPVSQTMHLNNEVLAGKCPGTWVWGYEESVARRGHTRQQSMWGTVPSVTRIHSEGRYKQRLTTHERVPMTNQSAVPPRFTLGNQWVYGISL